MSELSPRRAFARLEGRWNFHSRREGGKRGRERLILAPDKKRK